MQLLFFQQVEIEFEEDIRVIVQLAKRQTWDFCQLQNKNKNKKQVT